MKLIDSHCHLNFSSFKDDYKEIIADCLNKEIGIINIGSQIDTSKRALKIANEYPNDPIYASIGLHPVHLSQTEVDEEEVKFRSREEVFDENKYQEILDEDKNKKIIAIGEIGLDYFHQPTTNKNLDWKELQKQGFIQQLKFAQKNNLLIILHARGSQENPEDAYLDLLEILYCRDRSVTCPKSDRFKTCPYTGVIHCFGSSLEIAQKFLDLGFYIGFTGIITFKNKSVDELREVVKAVPLNKILIETDAPYLSPEPCRGEKNKPQNVEFVARKIAELKKISYKEVCKATRGNVERLFEI